MFFCFDETATTEIYPYGHTLSLPDALPIFAPEAEFYVFDKVRFATGANEGFYHIDSEAGAWNSGKVGTEESPNRGYKVKYKGGYFPVAPYDHFGELRDEMVIELEKSGLLVERAHHEVGHAGKAALNSKLDALPKAADRTEERRAGK